MGNLGWIETLDLSMNKLSSSIQRVAIFKPWLTSQFMRATPVLVGVHYQLVAKTMKKHLKFQVEMEERMMMTVNLKSYCSSSAWSWRYAYFHFLDKVKDDVFDFVSAMCTYMQKRS
ncbi:hypothetical protein Pyn_11757 [Prunus yedoensis var. nudiflora]|uniref:Uncharacterized protein n=1 Tax=Prunus yedoensis var. nudiflora TaxID=2094558 RepID=A0A314UAL6_PRUYE|nr:hypothetical protein Pyn_11757 [Prunus yedoensis var. nudiflora]